MARSEGISLKKRYGQHFLRSYTVVHQILSRVELKPETSVFEIGCGDGFLTRAILQTPIARLWTFDIDPEWVAYVKKSIDDPRLEVFLENILDVDFSRFEPYKPWTLLANLPYQITFPILYMLQRNRHLLREGVIMIQEEVAQELVKKGGRGFGFSTLYFQYYFELKLLEKVPPAVFHPPPKVYSRLLYLKPRVHTETIPDEEKFWKFIKVCFIQPRRTLRNNLKQSDYAIEKIPEAILGLRAQQLKWEDLVSLWNRIRNHQE